ncbi:MAG: hypothetical protein Q9162_000301 [Coniocarpon cinnabarinum]
MLDPKTFPRPPKLEKVDTPLAIKWPNGDTIIETTGGYRMLETYHAPTYYLPRSDVKAELIPNNRKTFCEWKGSANYFNIKAPDGTEVENRIWTYEQPSENYQSISGFVCFYVGPWDCYVGDEKVEPQPGDYYGGWQTSDILKDSVKGGPGTLGW